MVPSGYQHGKTKGLAMGLVKLVVIEDDQILKLMLPKQGVPMFR